VAQSTGLLCPDFIGATTGIRRRAKLMGKTLGVALVPALTGGMLGGAGLTVRSAED